ncbi:hypothetical protein [Maricaulis maris]|uniref:EAL domain-containing protein n=1 Tax=Maricaulis maris TaxID=74318 RepID=A0A495D3U6_9PROT|nr:hypothetical protein [Maricaulis maris]RKQ96585.1 hypothetical protein C7435_1917 [Maricaulis maris]
MSPELRQKLKTALVGRESVDMGQFQFLNLERVRARTGEDWPRLREKVYETSTQFIERRLGPDDVMIRVQGGFLIIFRASDVEAAQDMVDAISGELNTFFLGEAGLEDVRTEADARDVPTSELLEIVARSQPHDHAGQSAISPDAGAGLPADLATPWASSSPPERDDDGKTRWVEAPKPERRDRPSLVPGQATAAGDVPPSWDDIVFKPVWDSRKSYVSHHICVARKIVDGFAYYGRETLSGAADRDQHRRLDRVVALAAQRGFQKARAAGHGSMIIVPVHYDSLSSVSRRMEYFKILQPIPEPARRFFLLRIDGVPDGAPMAQLQEVCRSMKHFGAYVLVHHRFGLAGLDRFESCGIGIFSADTPPRLNDAGAGDKDLMACVTWVSTVQQMSAETSLLEIENTALLEAAMSAGVRYFSGPGIAAAAEMPGPPRRLSLSAILAPPDSTGGRDETFEID